MEKRGENRWGMLPRIDKITMCTIKRNGRKRKSVEIKKKRIPFLSLEESDKETLSPGLYLFIKCMHGALDLSYK